MAITAGLVFGVAAVASANGEKPTKFTVRVENITLAEAFTASNGTPIYP